MTMSDSKLREVIAANLMREWIDHGPSKDCFDRDEGRMGLLLGLIAGVRRARGCADARRHLLACPRCRFLFARLREVTLS